MRVLPRSARTSLWVAASGLAAASITALVLDTRSFGDITPLGGAPSKPAVPIGGHDDGGDIDVHKVPRCTHDMQPCRVSWTWRGSCCLSVASSNVTGSRSVRKAEAIPDAEKKQCGVRAKFFFLPCARYTGRDCGGVLVHPAGFDTCQ